MSDTAPGPGTTSSRVRLPIDDVIDDVYRLIVTPGDVGIEVGLGARGTLALLCEQTPYVLAGVLRKYRSERGAA